MLNGIWTIFIRPQKEYLKVMNKKKKKRLLICETV